MPTVTCGACSHPATILAPSDAWKCNCWADVSDDPKCQCDALNDAAGTEDNPPTHTPAEVARLLRDLEDLDLSEPGADEEKQRLLFELRGAITPEGVVR